jgi:23S rRNA (adenine2503-C2)-methyltransferase
MKGCLYCLRTAFFYNIFTSVEEAADRISLAGMGPDETEEILSRYGIDPGYALRLLYWIYRKRISTFTLINDIPKKVIKVLEENFDTGITGAVSSAVSSDGSVKYLFINKDGLEYETVYIPDGKRHTVCVSVQSGCRMGCRFCATGRNGLKGNLTAGEIISQVLGIPHEVTHVVMMGMGEPGDNPDEVIRACRILTAEWGPAIGKNRVTVSTAGVTPFVRRLLGETGCNITLSLHSPFPEERVKVIPAERRWPAGETLDLLRSHQMSRGRRFTMAYVMIRGKNDTGRHLEELKRLLSGTAIRVNLLPYHRLSDDDDIFTSDEETMMRFKHELVISGIGASVRRSRGNDIAAACGMLAAGRNDRY